MTTAAKKAPARKKAPAKKAAATPAPAKAETVEAPALKAEKPVATEAPAAAAMFALPSFEMPTALASDDVVDLAEKSIANARDFYEQAKASMEEKSNAFEKSMLAATESSKDLQGKVVEAAKSNIDAGFSFLNGMIAAKSLSEAIELQSSFAAKQFETLSAQGKDIQESLTKSFEEASAPMKAAADKAMESLKVAS